MPQTDYPPLILEESNALSDIPVSSNIFAVVEGIEVCALMDSGSFTSIVSEDF